MRKKKFIFLSGFIFIIVLAIMLSSLFFKKKLSDSTKIEVYFYNPSTRLVQSETRYISNKNQNDNPKENILFETLDILFGEPANKNLVAFETQNLKTNSIIIHPENIVSIDFSREYKNLDFIDEIFFRSALVWTLTSLDFVDNVSISIDGVPLKKTSGDDMGLLNRNNLVINPEISDKKTNLLSIKLYFRRENNLLLENRTIIADPDQSPEKYVLEEIISGPKNPDLVATVPVETKIRDIKTDENICYVSLSNEFINKSSDTQSQKLALYSIVNSLTELEHIDKVQFLIESEKTDQPEWCFDLSKPFARNEKIIKKDNLNKIKEDDIKSK